MVYGYTIDLSNGIRQALELLRFDPDFFTEVESLIICRPPDQYYMMEEESDLYSLFVLVGSCMPRLETLTLHFDDLEFPVFILTAFLQEATGLFDLGLFHVRLSGSPREFEEMEQALQQHVGLEGVRLVHCKRHEDEALGMPYTENTRRQKRIPRIFCQSRNLRRLWLQDCPDNHIVAVAQAIHEGDTQLKELSIVSAQVGENGVESLSQMLQAQTTLDVLRITLFRFQAIRVAESVAANSTLKKLTCDILVPHNKPSLLTDGPMRI